MTTVASLIHDGGDHFGIAAAAVAVGAVALSPEGNVVVCRDPALALTDQVRYDNQKVYLFTKGAIAFAEGDTVYFDGTDIAATGFVRVGRCAAAAASGDAVVAVRLMKDAQFVSYTKAAAGTALTNTTTPTNLAVAPAIPANVLRAGDRIRIRVQVIAPLTNASDTLALKLRLVPATGSAIDLVTIAAVNVSNNDIGYIDFEVVVRTIGATGAMVGAGVAGLGTPGTVTALPASLPSSLIDTTIAQTIGVLGTWSAADPGNSCRLDVLNVDILRA